MDTQRILVVEDHEPLLVAIQDLLEMEGYAVSTAADGAQALQMMQAGICPDLIVSDIMMPRMDGYAFREAVRAHPEWESIPFIFLTAKTENGEKADLAEDYIVKPFEPQELIRAVRVWRKRTQAT